MNDLKVTASAWSTTIDGVSGANAYLDKAYLGAYPGLGVTNQEGSTSTSTSCGGLDCREGTVSNSISPEHATDNNQRYDAILFVFMDSQNKPVNVKLQDVQISYPDSNTCNGVSPCDSDISVLAYTGSGAPNLQSAEYKKLTDATTGNWKLVGDYSNVKDSTVPVNIDGTGNSSESMTALVNQTNPVSSPYWIVAAYSPILQGTSNSYSCNSSTTGKPATGVTCDGGNDYVKVISLFGSKTTTNKVPEPSSLLLLGMAATIGVWGTRRHRTALAR